MNTLTTQLIDFGLTEKEAKTYLALLDLGTASASEIADKAEVNRSSLYVVLESLKKRGLVSFSLGDSKVRKYLPAPPERLLYMAEKELRDAEQEYELAEELLPELRAEHAEVRKKPQITVYEGKEGVMAAYNDVIDNNPEGVFRACLKVNEAFEYFPEFLTSFIERYMEIGTIQRTIQPDEPIVWAMLEKYGLLDHNESLIIPAEKFNFPASFAIYSNKVTVVSYKDDLAVIIESDEIANGMKVFFELAWEEAKRLDKYKRGQGEPC